jgi:hypothetical protein
MSLPSKNSKLSMFAAIAVSTMLLSAVTKADANPYLEGDSRIAQGDTTTQIKKTTTVKPAATVNGKKKIQSVPGAEQGKKDPHVEQGGPIFVKSGSDINVNKKVLPQSGAKSIPSAVDVEKKIKPSTNN